MRTFCIRTVAVVLVLVSLISLASCATAKWEETSVFLTATDKVIYFGNKAVTLKGVNLGGYFVFESWMCPVETADYLTLEKDLTDRFGKEKAEELIGIYQDNWIKEEDFKRIASLGLNCVRVPIAYFNFTDAEGNFKKNAFKRLDFVLDCAEKYGLWVILDMHGAYGSQNGKDHSGDTRGAELFQSLLYKGLTTRLWKTIAERYKNRTVLAGYDLLNEPSGKNGNTSLTQWYYYDEIYEAIRAIDKNHIIFIESVWGVENLPKPERMGWENVVYEYHFYNWGGETEERQSVYLNDCIKNITTGDYVFNVPVLIGEFNCFDAKAAWENTLSAYNENGWSWTFWSYKSYGLSSWGLYGDIDVKKVDPKTFSYEEIEEAWSNVGTENSKQNEWLTAIVAKHSR